MRHCRLVLLLVLALGACSRAQNDRTYARDLAAAHASADRAASDEDARAAIRELQRIFDLPPPPSKEAALLRQDAADRIARSYLRLREPQAALLWTQRALAESEEATVLRAALLITEADALEALGRRDEAREALMSALDTNQTLLHVELENP